VIAISGLTKRYGNVLAVDDLTLEVPAGSVCGLLGRNGSGKTTTFKCLLGFAHPDAGEVRFDGELLAPKTFERLGYVPERPALYNWLSVAQHLDLSMGISLGAGSRGNAVELGHVALAETQPRGIGIRHACALDDIEQDRGDARGERQDRERVVAERRDHPVEPHEHRPRHREAEGEDRHERRDAGFEQHAADYTAKLDALDADVATPYSLFYFGSWALSVGGTSAVAPNLAAMYAQFDGYRVRRLGLAQAGLYNGFWHSTYPGTAWHDIISGSNGTYGAHAGYDNVTGVGSLNAYRYMLQIPIPPRRIPL